MRRIVGVILLALLAWIAAEIAVFVLLGRQFGFAPTLVAVLIVSAIGLALLRSRMRRLFVTVRGGPRATGFQGAVDDGRGSQTSAAIAATVGSFLLLVPGFISGVTGAVLQVPPVGRTVGGWVGRHAHRRLFRMLGIDPSVLKHSAAPQGGAVKVDSERPTAEDTVSSLDAPDHSLVIDDQDHDQD